MKTIELKGTSRTETGKSAMKKIRRDGNVPAVVYGLGEPSPVAVGFQAMTKVLYSPDSYLVNLEIDGKTIRTVVRDAQFHPVTDNVLHVDFLRVDDAHPVEIELPVKLVGTAKGVLMGGKLVPMLRKVKVRGIASKLPDRVEINVANLELGKTIRVGDVNFEGLQITTSASAGIAIIEVPRAVRTTEEAAVKK